MPDRGRRTLIVFARVPRPGRVKTRLAATIGEAAALAAYRELLGRTVALAQSVPGASLALCVEGDDVDGECAALAERHRMAIARQQGEDLGQRMHHALVRELRAGRLPVLIGCDCPSLSRADLEQAFDALARHDAVFAPTEDGGYALVGIARELPQAFRRPAWGTAAVMQATRDALRAQGADWHELRTLWDVDDVQDYGRWLRLRESG